jgi:hypothetical protein
MDLKTTYTEWLDYCKLAADDIQSQEQAFEQAAGSMWLNYGRKWDLVYAVRAWETELFDQASSEVADWGPQPNPDDCIRAMALSMTSTKIEQVWEAQ